ncbi:LysR family transcriptional regulator [uncultured Phascolarctobacterium sp.]|uniref:LysR family transcriptional regulator n=1 Tax=Phascolarctobacterium sp. TaxID=2049039 RepID=UPI0025E61123|nr:LysR family transcriptional regulator [uncultured Phascolarctobacterium sp.]
MELRLLRYFLAVVREGNITKAADFLHITQPTLSRQIAQLEEELDVVLFSRDTRRLELTNEGILLRRRAEEILALVDKTEQELSLSEEMVSGMVSVTCGEIESVWLLAELFQAFSAKYPNVTYGLYTGNAEYSKERIDSGLSDIGLLLEPVDIDKYDFIRLPVVERWGVLMRTDDPLAQKDYVTPADLAGQKVVLPWRQKVRNELISWFGDYFQTVHILINSNMSTNASIMVYNKLGYALCIEGGRPFLDTGQICCKPMQPPLTATTVLAWKKHQPVNIAVKKFIEYAREFLQKQKNEPH